MKFRFAPPLSEAPVSVWEELFKLKQKSKLGTALFQGPSATKPPEVILYEAGAGVHQSNRLWFRPKKKPQPNTLSEEAHQQYFLLFDCFACR